PHGGRPAHRAGARPRVVHHRGPRRGAARTSCCRRGDVMSTAAERLEKRLREAGVPDEEITEAERKGELGLLAIDRLLPPGPPEYNRLEVAERAGMDPELARRLWRGLGFPDLADDEVAFGDEDVEVLRAVCQYMEQGLADPEVIVQLSRVIGSSMARIAEAQLGVIQERLEVAGLTGDDAVEFGLALINVVKPD